MTQNEIYNELLKIIKDTKEFANEAHKVAEDKNESASSRDCCAGAARACEHQIRVLSNLAMKIDLAQDGRK